MITKKYHSNSPLNQRFTIFRKMFILNNEDFADAINTTRRKVELILRGENEPQIDILVSIITSIPKFNMRWFLLGEGEMFSNVQKINMVSDINSNYTVQKQNSMEELENQVSNIKNEESMESELVKRLVSLLEMQQRDIRFALEIQHTLASKLPNLGEALKFNEQAG